VSSAAAAACTWTVFADGLSAARSIRTDKSGTRIVAGQITDTPTYFGGVPLRMNEDGTELTDIVSLKQSAVSTMPEGLINALTPQQVADLLEYLAGLKGAPGVSSR